MRSCPSTTDFACLVPFTVLTQLICTALLHVQVPCGYMPVFKMPASCCEQFTFGLLHLNQFCYNCITYIV